MERKLLLFYGTPLNRSLNDDQPNDKDGPINARRARLNQRQTVRDSQGRQRFHGAFTGGFSAGYFNTVDSTAGFQPRQFVSHRGGKRRDEGESSFSHKPEDYMDEEDLGEFGIAPKKIRVCNQYSSDVNKPDTSSNLDDPGLRDLLRPVTLSIGEMILKRMSTSCSTREMNNSNIINCQKYSTKNNFHGLGYKPLEVAARNQSKAINPLTAVLGSGRRLKISGEAFGVGVLEDNEDYLGADDAYGYDDIRNYEFSHKSILSPKSKPPSNQTKDNMHEPEDHCKIPGFTLAKQLDTMQICDDIETKYPMPSIADDWKMPARAEPYIPPLNPNAIAQQLALKSRHSSSSFTKKFISGSESLRSDLIDNKAGLLLYSDLKANDSRVTASKAVVESQTTKATITRRELEWRPCSLLCKHFNVPNPYPDNLFSGVKPSNLIEQHDDNLQSLRVDDNHQPQSKENYREPASMELKRLIFDVTFTNHPSGDGGGYNDDDGLQLLDSDKTDSEDEPQVVEIVEDLIECNSGRNEEQQDESNEDDATDLDVIIVTAPRREPEVIVLSSSSSSPSPASSPRQPVQGMHGNDKCHMSAEIADDTYGPPLPPSLKTLIDLDHRKQQHHYHGSRSKHRKKKKKNKHKGSRRNS